MDQGSWVIHIYIVATESEILVEKKVNQEFKFSVNKRNNRKISN